jgi:KDO2-lipid IV(A) lauroyltransferase
LNLRDRFREFIADLPPKRLAHAGKALGLIIYVLDRRHRRIVRRNLQFANPGWPRERVWRICREVYQSLGTTIMEICQMKAFSSADILRKVRIKGKNHFLQALKSPNGAIIVSAHLGNWEMASLFGSCYLGVSTLIVARQLKPRILDKWMYRLRSRFGVLVIDKKQALPKMLRTLRQGGVLGVLVDQGTRLAEGVEADFFDRKATATPAPALLARRLGSTVIPVFCVREKDAGLTLVVYPPLNLQRTDSARDDLRENTQMITRAVEHAIAAYPEQWFWFHKRWKRHYPQLYPEDLAKRERRRKKRRAQSRAA